MIGAMVGVVKLFYQETSKGSQIYCVTTTIKCLANQLVLFYERPSWLQGQWESTNIDGFT